MSTNVDAKTTETKAEKKPEAKPEEKPAAPVEKKPEEKKAEEPAKAEEAATEEEPKPEAEKPTEAVAETPEVSAKFLPEEEEIPEVPAAAPVAETALGMSKDDLIAELLTNPDQVIEKLAEKVIAKVDKRSQDQSEFKRAWDGFYEANSDLADFKDIVSLKAKELRAKWAKEKIDPPWAEGSKQLAEATRAVIKRIRGSESEVEEVGNSKAVVASSSGSPAPRKAGKNDAPSANGFAGQIQRMQASKGQLR